MIEIIYSPNLLRRLKKIKKKDKMLFEEILEKVDMFTTNQNNQSLKVHKLHGRMRAWHSFSVNYKIRVIFKYTNKKTEVNLLDVDNHDVYR